MIPAPLRAPPTGITDAGYKVRQGVFVLADSGRLAIANLKLPLALACFERESG
jgi:hypothetical protein